MSLVFSVGWRTVEERQERQNTATRMYLCPCAGGVYMDHSWLHISIRELEVCYYLMSHAAIFLPLFAPSPTTHCSKPTAPRYQPPLAKLHGHLTSLSWLATSLPILASHLVAHNGPYSANNARLIASATLPPRYHLTQAMPVIN